MLNGENLAVMRYSRVLPGRSGDAFPDHDPGADRRGLKPPGSRRLATFQVSDTQIGLLDMGIVDKLVRLAFHDHPAVFEHIAAVGEA